MSRNKGIFNLPLNYEPLIKAPLDARAVVQNFEDLVNPSTWEDLDGNIWIYQGMIVSVANDPSSGLYFLTDASLYTSSVSWQSVASRIQVDSSLSVANIGSGDASVYYGTDGSLNETHLFREIKAGSNIIISTSDNVIIIDASVEGGGSSGTSIDGGVWITDIYPTSSGNVGDKVTSSDGVVLDSCLTDTNNITVEVLALPGHTNYKPYVYINSNPVSLSASSDKPLFTGTISLTYNPLDASITVHHEDGASWSTIVDQDTPAIITSAVFTGGYPGSQTELKAGDTFDINIQTDVAVTSVILDDYGAFSGGTYSVSGTNITITGTIANRGTSTQNLGFRLRVVKSTGSVSDSYLSADHGSVDGVNIVKLNNTYPSISFGSISYPGSQQAIKSGESAGVDNTVTNYNTITYSSPNSELTVSNPTLYETTKIVTYLSGTYNISTNNLRIVANRAANNATTTQNTVVWIANTAATLTVANPSSRLRSGGNDGTSIQSHTITITASQRLLNAPTLAKDTGGTWSGSAFTGGPTTWTRPLLVHDDDAKGIYNWGAISGTNLAGIVTSTNSGATTYTLGGFVTRTVTVPAFGTSAQINVEVVTYTKTPATLDWSVKQLTVRSSVGDITVPQANTWSIDSLNINPTTINILDTAAAASSSQASTITISESI